MEMANIKIINFYLVLFFFNAHFGIGKTTENKGADVD